MGSENNEENVEDVEAYGDEDLWDEIELVVGRLVKISRLPRRITLEVEEQPGSPLTYLVSYDVSEEMSEEDFNDLRELIGEDVEVELRDGDAASVRRN
jgi:hypothetical protein